MATFIKPSQLKAAIPNPTDPLCQQFKDFTTFLDLVAKAEAFMFDDGGSLSADMQALICNLPCLGGSGTTTTSTASGGSGTSTAPGSSSVPGQVTLRVGHGFFTSAKNLNIPVVWNRDGLATSFDIYRGTVNDPNDANTVKIVSNGVPFTIGQTASSGQLLFDNGDHYAFIDTVPNGGTLYFYFVVPKNSFGSGIKSVAGTSDITSQNGGWAAERAPYNFIGGITLQPASGPYTIPAGVNSIRFILNAGGGAGAGGSDTHGGGGGGGGTISIGTATVTPGDVIQVYDASGTGNTGETAAQTDGADGTLFTLKKNGTSIATSQPGLGGKFSSNSDGAGGSAGSGGSAPVQVEIYSGFAGFSASGIKGGASGCLWGHPRKMPAHQISFDVSFNNFSDSGQSDGGAGSGSMATNNPNNIPVATGGSGGGGFAVIQFSA